MEIEVNRLTEAIIPKNRPKRLWLMPKKEILPWYQRLKCRVIQKRQWLLILNFPVILKIISVNQEISLPVKVKVITVRAMIRLLLFWKIYLPR
ncbi:hypothetical protein D3C72_2067150 [compost metagenome]